MWTPVVLVAVLLAAAVGVDAYDVGPRHLGWKGADPRTDPAGVVAPPLLDLPELVAPEPVADPAPVADLDAARVRRAVRGTLARGDVGPRAAVLVAGLSGEPVHTSGPERFVPASTTKMLTVVAALEVLGPDATFETRVVDGAGTQKGPREVVLVGGGDPLLASEPVGDDVWPPRADVRTLAAQTAESLAADGTKRVRLRYDTSLFEGPADNPAWEPSYVPDGVVSPITSLWVDRGVPESGWGRVDDPARVAAETFAAALRDEGVRVAAVRPGEAANGAELASVTSPTVAQIVERVVDVSDNELAEVLTRHIGLAVSGEGSFEAGTEATLATLEDLGVDTAGAVVHDGSGLSRDNRLSAQILMDVVRVAASEEHPHLRAAVVGLPVAGFSGSLTSRFAGEQADEGLGMVRAKTGTLTGVHALAGLVTGADGVPMVFVAAVDRVPADKSLDARAALDRLASALAACSCASDETVGGVG